MKRIYFALLLALCGTSVSGYAQLSGTNNFIRLPYKYNFNLYDYSIRIPISENWGVQVPFLKEYNASLTLSEEVRYSFYVYDDTLKKPVIFYFALPEKNAPCLELRITGYNMLESETALQSKAGAWERIDNPDEIMLETYQQIAGGKILTFRILAKEETEKEACRALIRSCKGPYDSNDYYQNYHPITYYAKDSTYYPSFGFGFVIDFDAEAMIYAQKCDIKNPSTMLEAALSFDDEDYDESEASTFQADGFDLAYQFVKSREYVKSLFAGEDVKTFDYAVAGIPATVYVKGVSFVPTIIVEIPLSNYIALLKFRGVTKENLHKVEKFLSQIYIDAAQKTGVPAAQVPAASFESLTGIEGIEEMYANEVKFNTKLPKGVKTISCLFPAAKVTLEMPVLEYQRTSMGDVKKNDKKVTIENEEEDSNYYIACSTDENVCIIAKLYKGDEVELLQSEIFDILSNSTSTLVNGYAVINKQKWTVVTVKNDDSHATHYSLVYQTALSNGTLLAIFVYSCSLDLSQTIEALLYKASFGK